MRSSIFVTLAVYLVGAVVLAASIPPLILASAGAEQVWRESVADRIEAALQSANLDDPREVDRVTLPVRSATGVTVRAYRSGGGAGGRTPNGPGMLVRPHGEHVVVLEYPNARIREVRGILRKATWAAIAATLAGLILLSRAAYDLFGAFRSLRSGTTGDRPSQQLFDVLEGSIRMLRGRESELRRLHDRERERANELATITATLVRSLSSGFIAFDTDGRIVDLNQAARSIVETEVDVAGRSVGDALRPGVFARTLAEALARRDALQRVEITEDDGRVIGLTSVPLLDERGRYFGMLALFADLTPVRKLETRLRETQSLADLGEMSAGIAHEFRNSLSTILGYLALARKSGDPPRMAHGIGRAEAEARELAVAVESLLVFARPMALQRQPVDLSDLVTNVAERLRELNEAVRVVIEAERVVVPADAALLSRAVENLLRNAYDAIAEKGESGGTIEIGVEAAPSPRITIADDGAGFDSAMAARMFVPFQSGKSNGFGVGLSLTRKIVLLHGGSVEVVPRERGGAVASIELPA
ncbi:MAG TPA: ATP-binding protein [Thermoanaerobaculia bacterium]|jgi:signal transduction histidine kinase|nr:ATP-binding protein [Thermoanaerobaculia bacterium]